MLANTQNQGGSPPSPQRACRRNYGLKQLFPPSLSRFAALVALAFAAVAAAIVPQIADAAPVDLTPPKNSLGYADEQGYFRNVQRFGSIRFSDGFELPLRFEFWSGRVGGEDPELSDFGWHGWHCGPLESVAEYYGGEKYLRLTLLCAKVLFLEQSADDATEYRTLDGAWTGIIDSEKKTVRVSRGDGWELLFENQRIASLRTDTGMQIEWQRDDQGRLLAVRESGGDEDAAPALKVEWRDGTPTSGSVDALVVSGRHYVLRFDGEGDQRSLAAVVWRDRDAVHGVEFQQDRSRLQITGRDGSIRRFDWNPATGRLRSDGLNSYRVLSAEGRPRRIEMTTSTGEVLAHQIDSGRGRGRFLDADGSETVIHRVTGGGPTHGFISHIELIDAGRPVTVLRNHFDADGRLVARDWMGQPRWLENFSGGRVEPPLFPNREVIYKTDLYAGADTPLVRIDYRLDGDGRHTATEIDGQPMVTIRYAADGYYSDYRIAGRFQRKRKMIDAGGSETRLVIPGVTDVPFGYLESGDSSITERLIVRERRDAADRPIERQLLDGSTLHLDYHPQTGRPKHEWVIARDAETKITESTFVYRPDGRKMLVIKEDFRTGQLSYREMAVSAYGKPLDSRPLSASAAEQWTQTATRSTP